MTEDTDGWHVTVSVGDTEHPVYLARNPGSQRSDYAFDPSRALRDEPEVIGEDAADIIARLTKTRLATTRPDRRPWAA